MPRELVDRGKQGRQFGILAAKRPKGEGQHEHAHCRSKTKKAADEQEDANAAKRGGSGADEQDKAGQPKDDRRVSKNEKPNVRTRLTLVVEFYQLIVQVCSMPAWASGHGSQFLPMATPPWPIVFAFGPKLVGPTAP
jgi:hypothetical protein